MMEPTIATPENMRHDMIALINRIRQIPLSQRRFPIARLLDNLCQAVDQLDMDARK